MEITREKMITARDRALQAVSVALTEDDARAKWRLAKAANRRANECGEAGMTLENVSRPLATRAGTGGWVGREL